MSSLRKMLSVSLVFSFTIHREGIIKIRDSEDFSLRLFVLNDGFP